MKDKKSKQISLSYRRVKLDGEVIREKQDLIELAREFRKSPTDCEKKLWEYLRDESLSGLKFHRQHPIGGYIVDFYNRKYKVAIEIDGSIHDLQKTKCNDIARQKYLEDNGIKFIRFTNDEVINDCNKVVATILARLELIIADG